MSIFKKISFILSVIILSLLFGYAIFGEDWTGPSCSPPNCNVSPPINISSTAQTKEGALTVEADFTATRFLDFNDPAYYIDPSNNIISGLFAGNVGIGTTPTSEKLTVAGNIGIQAGANAFIGTLDNYGLGLKTSNTYRIFIANNGNVGIGTTTPQTKLEIFNNSDEILRLSRSGASYPVKFRLGSDSGLVLNVGNTDLLTLKNNENVGIGTTNPQTKLDVAGAIKIAGEDATCTPDTVGAVRYIPGQKKFEGCNGKKWKLIASVFPCGDEITFKYKGGDVKYGTVFYLGKCWMDRNLGATATPTSPYDERGFGDLFQWGRLDDGHQARNSATTNQLSSTDIPGHDKFITSTKDDWRSTTNNNLWHFGINNPCPPPWRVPTKDEWQAVITDLQNWGYSFFNTPLKLTLGGERVGDGTIEEDGKDDKWIGYYWSSDFVSESRNAYYLELDSDSNGHIYQYGRIRGMSVRCVLDYFDY